MVWKLLSILLLVGLNAFFVAAEFGLVAVRRTRIDELAKQGSRRAFSAQKAIGELNLMLSGCQLGITFASLGLGWIGEPTLAHLFEGAFDSLGSPFDVIATHGTAVAIAFAIITGLHVVLGELVPKNLAIAVPEGTALWLATPMRVFTYALRPLIWLFNESANVILRLLRVTPQDEVRAVHTPEELAIIVGESEERIGVREAQILTRTLGFAGKRAVEAMVPRTSARALGYEAVLNDVLTIAEETGYSRFPVWKERPDEFVGVVHLKDMLRASKADPNVVAGEVMRGPVEVPESAHLTDVLLNMQRQRNHFAIVLDEFGSTAGIITLEDILEELVGEIRDEYDVRELDVKKVNGAYRIPGTLRPDELAEATGCTLPEGEYETVAGFIMDRLGRIAKRGDEVPLDGWMIKVANVRRRRIVTVDVQPPAP